jgi:hypothetical protein
VAFAYDLDSVHLVGADGSGERAAGGFGDPSLAGHLVSAPFWSRDGRSVLVPTHGYSHYDPRSQSGDVYRIDASSGSAAVLHAGEYASFSRDGRYLAYQTYLLPPGGGVIGVCRSDGSHDTPFGAGSYAAWATDADRIAYVTRAGYLTVSTPVGYARWTFRGMKAGPIAWAVDGKTILFAHAGSHPGLFSIAPGTRRARRLVDVPALVGNSPVSLSVSSNGRWVSIAKDSTTLLVRTNGSHLQELAGSAAWSPRGSTLALVSANTLSLWTPRDGAQLLYTGRQRLAAPAWSPDGTRIVVVDS